MSLLQLGPGQKASRGGRLSHRDGHAVDAELNATRLPDGRLQIVVRDRTEERRAHSALTEAEERYERLAEASPDAVLVEADGRIVFANGPAHRLLGREPGSLTRDLLLADLIHPDDREVAREELGRAALSRGSSRVAFRLRQADGTIGGDRRRRDLGQLSRPARGAGDPARRGGGTPGRGSGARRRPPPPARPCATA